MARQKLSTNCTSRGSVALGPLCWREIMESDESSCLPFAGYFEELAREALLSAVDAGYEEEIMKTDRIIEPVTEWQSFDRTAWGDNTEFVEDWFEEGEQIVNSKEELEIDEPANWERVLHWMRSIAVATGMMPA